MCFLHIKQQVTVGDFLFFSFFLKKKVKKLYLLISVICNLDEPPLKLNLTKYCSYVT